MKYFTILIMLFLSLSSCKSSKSTTTNSTKFKEMSARKVAKKHVSSNFDKETISTRLKVNYKSSTEKIGFSVQMKIKKDEVIWLKGTKFITVFKAKITPEKVQFYSPFYKNYFDGDFSMLKKILGTDVNFKQLQNMLLGQSLLNVKSERQELEIDNKSYLLSPKKQSNLFNIFFYVNPTHFKLDKQSIVNLSKNQRLDIAYPKYLNKGGVLYPEKIDIVAKQSNKFTAIDIITRSVDFNTEVNVDFKMPNGYKEIKL